MISRLPEEDPESEPTLAELLNGYLISLASEVSLKNVNEGEDTAEENFRC